MRILIATPLEPELVERIVAFDSAYDVVHEADLLPPVRFPCDHRGVAGWRRDAIAELRWTRLLDSAEVLFGFPGDTGPTLAAALAVAPRVRFVQGTAAGAAEVLREAELSRPCLERVAFTSAAGVHGGMLAEFVFFGLLALRKDLRRLERIRAARSWEHFASGELGGSTIAILGLGHIGSTVARIAHAFGMRVLGINRDGAAHPAADATYATSDLASAFAQADAVVVTLPDAQSTRGLVSAAALAALRRDAIFCNVGRGSVVDQAALVDALQQGRIGGAVLDVSDPEPLPPDNPLWTLENVIFTPHTMALSVRENERIVDLFCDNLRRFARAEPLRNRIDPFE